MTHIIVKNGRVAVQNGRVVTSAGGAPCCCEDGGCYIIVTACGCECPTVRAIELTPELDAVWSADDRVEGKVIVTESDGCWEFLGSTRNPGSTPEIQVDDIVAVVDSCNDAGCGDGPPCPPSSGFTSGLSCCVGGTSVGCLARIRYEYQMVGHLRVVQLIGGVPEVSEKNLSASGWYEKTGPSSVPLWSYEASFWGIRNNGDEYGYTQVVDQSTPGAAASGIDPDQANNGTVISPWRGQTGAIIEDRSIGFIDTPTSGPSCNNRATYGGGGLTGFEENRSKLSRGAVSSTSWAQLEIEDDTSWTVGFQTRIRIAEIETTDGTIIELEGCDAPIPSIARACDKNADIQEVTYDAQFLPSWAVTIIDAETDQTFIPTAEVSDGTPIVYSPSPDTCPGPPDPGGDLYRIRFCRGGYADTTWAPRGTILPPIELTVAYRPGTGLAPGEGHVRIGVTSSGSGCVFSVAAQPTNEVYDGTPDVIIESRPELCFMQPSVNVDPRPECRGLDIGDPLPGDLNRLPADAPPEGNTGAIESHMAPITRCRGCGG